MAQKLLKWEKTGGEGQVVPRKPRISPKILIPITLLVAGIVGVRWHLSHPPSVKSLEVSGRIEGYETNIGAKFAGRVQFVAVREGDRVQPGQVIVRMDDADLQAQLQGATARLNGAQQEEQQARLQLNVLENQIKEWELNWQQARGDARGKVLQAESALASSKAQLNEARARQQQAQAELALAKLNRDRYANLVAEGAIPQQQFDQAQTALETARAKVSANQASVESFEKLVKAAQGQLQQAKTTALNPEIRSTQIQGLRIQLAQAQFKLAAAQSDVNNVKAARQEILSKIADVNQIISPIEGVVVSRSVEPGAVVTAGKTLLTVINPERVYLRGFVPEGEIGKVRVGQSARVFLDSDPDRPLSARVSAIDTQASFTPENIYFQRDRIKQVFGVKIAIDKPNGWAKPGMPADAIIKEH